MATVKITINGKEVEAEAGRWLIDVLNEQGCKIPHFCYHPGLGPDGNCRMCQVEFVTPRGGRLAISCNQPVMEGLNVVTNSDRVIAAREGVEESLLLNHPLDCPICDKAGECTLQNYYMAHDLKDSRQQFTRFKKNKALDIGPTMILDQERCVLCDRCVRFLRDWAGEEQLYIAGRGHGAYLTPFPGKPVDNPYSLNTYDLCPVGALTSKDFRFATPPWMLTRTPSVCTTCARGCAIEIDVDRRDNTVRRLRPRFNPEVNGHWMCDEGRLNYHFVNTDRIRDALVDRGGEKIETSLETGMSELAAVLGFGAEEPTTVVVLASATCTLEEMFALKMLAAGIGTSLSVARHVPDGIEDDKLRRADHHPNATGAELLGLPVVDFRDGADAGMEVPENGVLFAVGFDYDVSEALQAFCEKFSRVAAVSARSTPVTQAANVVLPGLTFAEKEGLVVNFEGHVQKLEPALDRLWDKTPPWQILSQLITRNAQGAGAFESIQDIRSQIGRDVAAFAGVDLNDVGATGVRLAAQTV